MKQFFIIATIDSDSNFTYWSKYGVTHYVRKATQFETYSDCENAIKVLLAKDFEFKANNMYQIEKVFI